MPYAGLATAGDVVAIPQAILNVYSLDIQHTAQGVMRFEEFAVRKEDLTKVPGETITFTRYADITRGGQLNEQTAMVLRTLGASTNSLTVTEWGNAIGLTEKLLRLSFDEMMAEAAVLLGRDAAEVADLAYRDALINNLTNVVWPGTAAALNQIAATDYFDTELIRNAVEVLQTGNTPKFNGDFYVCFIHPHAAAYLKRDPDWVAANNYANTRALFNGELGRWEDVIFVGTTNMNNGAAAVSAAGYEAALVGAGLAGQDLYRAVMFGDACLAKADALPVEMRESGVIDFGRKHGLAWYEIAGYGLLYDSFGCVINHS